VVLFSLNDKVKYDDLVNIEKNSVGDIVLLTANSHKINTLAHEIVKNSTLILDNELSKGVPIPIMAFSGIEALSGYGKVINVKFFSVSSVSCEFNSRFDSMGINQTLHSIYIDIICKVEINLPFDERTIECVNSVLVSESVLLGKVPDALINGKIFS
jgi:sporulation protein YunB